MASGQMSEASYDLEDQDQKMSQFEKEDFSDNDGEDIEQNLPNTDHIDKGWRSLFGFVSRRQYWLLAVSLGFTLVSGLLPPVMAVILGDLFQQFARYAANTITRDEFLSQISRFSLGLTALGCLSWWINGTFFSLWMCFGEAQARSARETVFGSLLKKEMVWFENHKDDASSSLVSRCQSYIRDLQIATSQPLGTAIRAFIMSIASLCVAIYYSWSLALVILAGLPVAFVIVNLLSTRLQNHIDVQSINLSYASKIATRAIISISTIKAYNNQSQEAQSYTKSIHRAAEGYEGQVHSNALQIGFVRLIVLSMFVQGFWYGSRLVRQGESAGSVMTTFWSSLMAAQAIEMMLPNLMVLEKGKAAASELKNILKSDNMPARESTCIEMSQNRYMPSTCHGFIYLQDVTFSYPMKRDKPILQNVNLSIAHGETIFIVGKSGSGKSTIASLLLGIWKPDSGHISIDERSIKCLNKQYLLENITLVQQQGVLFNETVHRNLCFGNKDHEKVHEAAIKEACDFSCLSDVLKRLPYGINTVVGVGGADLSGGERQRLALARAKLRDSPILILDESISALDEGTRKLIMDNIRQWRSDKTTIIITHDLGQICNEDYVYVMDSGRIVECGTKERLGRQEDSVFRNLLTGPPDQDQDLNSELDDDTICPDMNSQNFTDMEDDCQDDWTNVSMLRLSSISRRKSHRFSVPNRASRRLAITSYIPPFPTDLKQNQDYIVPPMDHRLQRQTSKLSLKFYNRPNSTRIPSKNAGPSLFQIYTTIVPSLDLKSRIRLSLGFLASTMNACCTPTFAFALSKLFATMLRPNSAAESTKWSCIVLAIAITDAFTSYVLRYLLECCGQTWVDVLRTKAFSLIMSQCCAWFDEEENKVSRLMEILEKNAEEMRNLLGRFAAYIYVSVIMMVVGLAWSFMESWKLTLVGLTAGPAFYIIIKGLSHFATRWEAASNRASERTGTIFQETISNIKTVQILNLGAYFQTKHSAATKHAIRVGIQRSLVCGLGYGFSGSAILYTEALVFYYAGQIVAKDPIKVENVLAVIALLLFCLSNANAVVSLIPQISNSKDTARQVLRLTNLSPQSDESLGNDLPSLDGFISLYNVNFAYPSRPNQFILRNLSLQIHQGECIAIVGPSGSGKSTIASLLQRLHQPLHGVISFSGHAAHEIDVTYLRSHIAVVSQTPIVFPTTIRANILYGIPLAQRVAFYPQSVVESVARAVGIHDWIISLPHGYNTVLRSADGSVSGGQAQRITLARALIRKPKILILDECTSALDSENASLVVDAIERITRSDMHIHSNDDKVGSMGVDPQQSAYDRLEHGYNVQTHKMTVIIITHKQELMRIAHRVVVVDQGMVVEDGTYTELKRKGPNGKLVRLLSVDRLK